MRTFEAATANCHCARIARCAYSIVSMLCDIVALTEVNHVMFAAPDCCHSSQQQQNPLR